MNRFRIAACGVWLLAVGWLPQGSTIGAEIKDAEAATHGDEAASYQVGRHVRVPRLQDRSIRSGRAVALLLHADQRRRVPGGRSGPGHLHLCGGGEEGGVKITGVWLTHSHADFVAGHIEFAKQLVFPSTISEKAGAGYEHIAEGKRHALTWRGRFEVSRNTRPYARQHVRGGRQQAGARQAVWPC